MQPRIRIGLIIGALLAAGAGAGVGYFTAQDQPSAPPPAEMMS